MPQEILNENYNHLDKADIFSLGATIYELIRRSPLPDSGSQILNLREGKLPLLPGHSLQFQNLLKVLLILFCTYLCFSLEPKKYCPCHFLVALKAASQRNYALFFLFFPHSFSYFVQSCILNSYKFLFSVVQIVALICHNAAVCYCFIGQNGPNVKWFSVTVYRKTRK